MKARIRSAVFSTGVLLLAGATHAAIIRVKPARCTLPEAVIAANDDRAHGGCTAGSGPDHIFLRHDIDLTELFGEAGCSACRNATPTITSDITIVGRGGRREIREKTGYGFTNSLHVAKSGRLKLRNVAVLDGSTAIFNEGGSLHLIDTVVAHNSRHGLNEGTAEIRRSVFRRNTFHQIVIHSGNGAGVYNAAGGVIKARRSTFIANHADYAGAIFNAGTFFLRLSTLTLNGSDAIENHGRMLIRNSSVTRSWEAAITSTGRLTIENTTLSANTWGVQSRFHGSKVRLRHVTITGSTGSEERGTWPTALSIGGALTMEGTIIAGNHRAPACGGNVDLLRGGANLSDDASCPSDRLLTGLDPFLGLNGGKTETHALRRESSAVDAAGFCDLANDQRLAERVGPCDSGAYELSTTRLDKWHPVLVFGDEFRSNDLSRWSKVVHNVANFGPRLVIAREHAVGPFLTEDGTSTGLGVIFSEGAASDQPAYLVSRHPRDEKTFNAVLSANFDELELDVGESITFLQAFSAGGLKPEFEIRIVAELTGDRVWKTVVAVVRDGNGTRETRTRLGVDHAKMWEWGFHWTAATRPGSTDGTFGCLRFGYLCGNLDGIDNHGAAIHRVLVGALAGDLDKVSGHLSLDRFLLFR